MNKKLTILFAALLLGTALSGVAYAHWSKIITIDGRVDTGELHVFPFLSHDGYYEWTAILDEGKGVAYFGDIEDCGITSNYVSFELYNTYPCLDINLDLEINNDGTIPAGLYDVRYIVEYWNEYNQEWTTYPCQVVREESSSDDDPYDGIPDWIKYKFYPPKSQVINDADHWMWVVKLHNFDNEVPVGSGYPEPAWPCSIIQVDPNCVGMLDMNIHFYEGLVQDMQFRFKVELEYWNWNEVPNLHPGPYVDPDPD